MKAKYTSPFSVGKRQTIPIDINDPRLRGYKAGITASRLGAEINIVGDSNLYATSFLRASASGNNGLPGGTPSDSILDPNLDPSTPSTLTGVTNLVAVWSGTDLLITFDFDTTDPLNYLINGFFISLTGDGVTTVPELMDTTLNVSSTSQSYKFKYLDNLKYFGPFQTTFSSLSVTPYDKFSKRGPTTTITNIPAYNNGLPAPTIHVSAITQGYSVDWDTITQTYAFISIEEVVSNLSTAPSSGYQQVYLSKTKPAAIICPTTEKRWVRARFTDNAGTYGPYSDPVTVTPISPIAFDNQPPNEVTSVSAAWSNDNIVITYTLPASDQGVRFQAVLTAPNNLVGYFYFFLESGNTHTITANDLFLQFGEHYNSFTGILKSIDASDNRSNGVAFNVPQRQNPLAYLSAADVAATFNLTASANAYTVNFTLPNFAKYAEVYAKTTAWDSNPTNYTYRVAAGVSPLVVLTQSTSLQYVIIRYYDDFNDTSVFSTAKTVTPYDPGVISLINNPIKISTNGSIFAGDSDTSYPRVYFNKDGLFAYDGGQNKTTQIVNSATNGQPTFITTRAQIADWFIKDSSIENTLSPKTSNYTGLSGSGTYAFWAGSSTSGGDSNSQFYVKPDGTVKANNITITGGSLQIGSGFSVAATTGILTASGADITGRLTVTGSSTITGNLQITSGSFLAGSSSTSNSVIINSDGLAAINSGGSATTEILTTPIQVNNTPRGNAINTSFPVTFFTKAALIGGWQVNDTTIADRSQQVILDSSNKYLQITGTSSNTNYFVRLSTHSTSKTGGANVFEAGTMDSNGSVIATNVSITSGGILTALGATLTGTLKSGSRNSITDFTNAGYFFNGTDGSFIAGGTSAYIQYNGTSITLNSGSVSSTDGRNAYSTAAKIVLNPGTNNLQLYGLPIQGGVQKTYAGETMSLLTEGDYLANNPNKYYAGIPQLGALPRQRMIVEDPVDGVLRVGMAVYYQDSGSPYHGTTDPTVSGQGTGAIGDLWVTF
jgi:hypothetical protein